MVNVATIKPGEVAEIQLKENTLKDIVRFLQTGITPAGLKRGTLVRFKKKAAAYFIYKGKLFKTTRKPYEGSEFQKEVNFEPEEADAFPSKGTKVQRVPLLQTDRDAVLRGCHEEGPGGHRGEYGTTQKILTRYWWPGVRREVKNYLKECHLCQVRDRHRPKDPQVLVEPTSVMDTLHMDLLGPFPVKKG